MVKEEYEIMGIWAIADNIALSPFRRDRSDPEQLAINRSYT